MSNLERPRIVGLDVCKGSVVAVLLTERPTEPRKLYYSEPSITAAANVDGLRQLLALRPDIAVLEPTGTNYSKLWVQRLAIAGVKICLVGHKELRNYRSSTLQLPDKDDTADAIALACYWFDSQTLGSMKFVRERDPVIAQIREKVLRLSHLARCQSPVINRIRQDLAWQFPECASKALNANLFWRWLAGRSKSVRYDRLLAESVGLGVEAPTRNHARRLLDLWDEEQILESEILSLVSDPRFAPYHAVFTKFGFGPRVAALLLSQIFPLENYLDENGQPEMIRSKRGSMKHLSLRRFNKALGIAPEREYSGDSKHHRKAGSRLCRTALWQWCFTRVEPTRSRSGYPLGTVIGDRFDAEKAVKPIQLARSRTIGYAVRMLFYELVDMMRSV
jgi:hypothetical protein